MPWIGPGDHPLCGETGVIQGDPLLPNIFDVVIYAVLRHWESQVAGATWGGQQR